MIQFDNLKCSYMIFLEQRPEWGNYDKTMDGNKETKLKYFEIIKIEDWIKSRKS